MGVDSENDSSRGAPVAQPAKSPRAPSDAWFATVTASLAVAATLTCLMVGYSLANLSDRQHADAQRAGLRAAVGEFRALFGNGHEVDPRFIRMIEQGAGLKDVRFEAEPAAPPREMQPVANAEGRLVGFLTWEPDAPMNEMFAELAPLVAGGAFGAVMLGGLLVWQMRRSRVALAESERRARDVAERDALTGLPNQAKVLGLLDAAMARRGEQDVVHYALMALDGIGSILEGYGQDGVHEIAGVVGARLRDHLPDDVACGRLGDCVFAFLWHGGRDPAVFMRDTIETVARPHWIDTMVQIRAHGGFACAPRDATTRDELVRRAELALHAAEKKGSGAVVAFDRAIDASASEAHFIRRELPRALAAQALDVHYQPIVTSDNGRIVGIEALLRWTHKDRGAVSPAQFVPIAEQMGLMVDLGAFVLRRALQDAKAWPDVYISVNLSPLQARDRGIVEVVRQALREFGVAPSKLMLEITEGVLIENPEDMLKRIQELRALGVRIALDDFGSGYSSLGYLQRFPFDKLKIDKSFVSALGRSSNASVIIQAVIALGRALGVTVVVEGVETEEQRVLLRLAGCDEMQGFLFAKPAAAKTIDRLIAQGKLTKSAVA